MIKSFLNNSSNELNEIESYSDTLLGNSYRIIPLEEIENLSDEVFPFNPSECHKNNEKKTFEMFNTVTRKNKEDDIRKKFKSGFHRCLKKIINTNLKKADSKYLFESLPQKFIADISRKTNYEVMNLTYEQLFDYTHNQLIANGDKNHKEQENIEKRNNAAEKKYEKNKKVLEYLSSNKKMSEESGWERIKNMKYIDLLKAYLNSKEFQQYIEDLSKKESKIYIDAFIYFTSTYIDFFLNYKPNKSSNYLNKNPQFSSNTEEINNASDFNIPTSMILPSTIFEIKEDDNDFSESLIFSGIEDYELRRENNLFNSRNLELTKKISY